MKKAYGIMIEEVDCNVYHIPELYGSLTDAILRRDSELRAIAATRIKTIPVIDNSHPTKALLKCGMFGIPIFIAKVIEFIVPSDYQTICLQLQN